jgi:hypothetical protein
MKSSQTSYFDNHMTEHHAECKWMGVLPSFAKSISQPLKVLEYAFSLWHDEDSSERTGHCL